MRLRNKGICCFLFILGILPILISIVINVRLGPEDYLQASSAIKGFIFNWFKLARIQKDNTLFLCYTGRINLLIVLHSFVCMIGGAILLSKTIKGKKKSLITMTIAYALLALISVLYFFMNLDVWGSGGLFLYNRFYLLFFDISVLHGPLPIIIYSAIVIGYFVFLWADLKKPIVN